MRYPLVLSAPCSACLLLLGSLLWTDHARSEPANESRVEQVTVLANHLNNPVDRVGSSVSVIDATAFTPGQDAVDLLRLVPNMSVSRSGPRGGLSQVRLRGSEANHTLVLIDGIEANDAANGSEFNYAHLTNLDIARIEVLRGAQSARYGADAIGGVIAIQTRANTEEALAGSVNISSGSHQTHRINGRLDASHETGNARWSGQIAGGREISDGENAAGLGFERDGFQSTQLRGSTGLTWDQGSELRLQFLYTDLLAESDKQDFDFPSTPTQGLVIDANDTNASAQSLSRLLGRHSWGNWYYQLSMAHTRTVSNFTEEGVPMSGLRGERDQVELQGSRQFEIADAVHSILLGGQYEGRSFRNLSATTAAANHSAEDRQRSIYVEYVYASPASSFTLSTRHDKNQDFADTTSWRITASRDLFAQLNVHGSWGEGTANPTFFELFGFIPDSFQGNPGLRPEESVSWDLGLRGRFWDDRISLGATYFKANLRHEITTVFDPLTFASSPINGDQNSHRRGWEWSLNVSLLDNLSAEANWTRLNSRDPSGREEVRRPKESGAIALFFDFFQGRGRGDVRLFHNGPMPDSEFIFATATDRVALGSYTTVGAGVSFQLRPGITVFARAENMLDREYSEVFGFRAPGASASVGFSLSP